MLIRHYTSSSYIVSMSNGHAGHGDGHGVDVLRLHGRVGLVDKIIKW